MPEIIRVALDLPTVRFTDITDEIEVRFSFYSGSGKLISSSKISGHGRKTLLFTRENYVEALQDAIRDLTLKAKDLFEKLAFPHGE